MLRISFRVEVDEEGVSTGDWLDSRPEPVELGDAVPSLESLFFLEDLLESLPRESCGFGTRSAGGWDALRMGEGGIPHGISDLRLVD